MSLGDHGNAGRQCRGEQRGLPDCRGRLEDALELVGKPHVEHFVGFVEHDRGKSLKIECLATDVVERAAGCGHHHMHPASQDLDLLAERLAAIDRHDGGSERASVFVEGFGHLHGEFARWHQHQERWPERHGASGSEKLQQRKRKGGGLAGARGGLAKEVATGEKGGDGIRLDRGRFLIAEAGQGFDERGREAEVGERCHGAS